VQLIAVQLSKEFLVGSLPLTQEYTTGLLNRPDETENSQFSRMWRHVFRCRVTEFSEKSDKLIVEVEAPTLTGKSFHALYHIY
jgi:hypothetical protein